MKDCKPCLSDLTNDGHPLCCDLPAFHFLNRLADRKEIVPVADLLPLLVAVKAYAVKVHDQNSNSRLTL